MAERTIAVTGAAGKTGRAVVAAAAARGATVRALVHRPEQAAAGLPGAAEVTAADLADPTAIGNVLDGVDAVYLIAPNMHPDEAALLGPVIDQCAASGPRRVVYHSVIHPYAPGMPHHVDKATVEALLAESGLDWTILQPASYFENALGVWDSVRDRGVWPLPYSADAPFTPVALADVAEVAATVLVEDWDDAQRDGTRRRLPYHCGTFELAGPEVLSTGDMARIATAELGSPVSVIVDRSRDAAAARPRRLQAMFDYYDAHGICGNPTMLRTLLGRAPMTWREWVAGRR